MKIRLAVTGVGTAALLVAFTTSASAATAVDLPGREAPASGNYCLANTWDSSAVSIKSCDSGDRGQHWTVKGNQISLTDAPRYCLANTWNAPDVLTKRCDTRDRGQHWTLRGNQISLTDAPRGYCLTNAWNTADVSSKRCDPGDPGQHWTVNGNQISLADA